MLGMLSKKDLTLRESRGNRLGISLAVSMSIVLFIVVAMIGVYPCGYYDSDSSVYAGQGYHSLSTVMANGFYWHSDSMPDQLEYYHGEGPFYVIGKWWISIFYIPIILAIVLLGMMVMNVTPAFMARLRGD